MTQKQIMDLQSRIGATPDGFWGPKSIAACKKHLRDMMPVPHPFPASGTKAFTDFYGPNGVAGGYTPPSKKIKLPFSIFYDGAEVKSLTVHEKCADSLLRVFERLAVVYPNRAARDAAGITIFNGVYNPRMMRGSRSSWSMHAWMMAIDLNAGKNGNKTSWPIAATMPIEVMECFAKEGWESAGAFWGRDAMHFQATKPV